MERQRRYRVTGIDEDGDVQAFETDDRERADDVHEQMLEDLNAVALEDRGEA